MISIPDMSKTPRNGCLRTLRLTSSQEELIPIPYLDSERRDFDPGTTEEEGETLNLILGFDLLLDTHVP
eukprot:1222823-Pleurochrysis_carterae.AAC.1